MYIYYARRQYIRWIHKLHFLSFLSQHMNLTIMYTHDVRKMIHIPNAQDDMITLGYMGLLVAL